MYALYRKINIMKNIQSLKRILLISLAFLCAQVLLAIVDPIVSSIGDNCSTVKFSVVNYDPTLTYTTNLDGSNVSLDSDGTYTVVSPVRNQNYTFSVYCADALGNISNTTTSTAKLPKQVVTPVIKADASACDVPVKFTITNYDASLDYTWEVEGTSYASNVETFVVSAPEDRATYTAQVKATDNCTSATSNSVSQTYIKSPAEPQISISHDCGFPIVFKLDNNSAYYLNQLVESAKKLDALAKWETSIMYTMDPELNSYRFFNAFRLVND